MRDLEDWKFNLLLQSPLPHSVHPTLLASWTPPHHNPGTPPGRSCVLQWWCLCRVWRGSSLGPHLLKRLIKYQISNHCHHRWWWSRPPAPSTLLGCGGSRRIEGAFWGPCLWCGPPWRRRERYEDDIRWEKGKPVVIVNISCKLIIPNSWTPKGVEGHLVHTRVGKFLGCEEGHGCSERVTSHHYSVGGMVVQKGKHFIFHIVQHIQSGRVKPFMHLWNYHLKIYHLDWLSVISFISHLATLATLAVRIVGLPKLQILKSSSSRFHSPLKATTISWVSSL